MRLITTGNCPRWWEQGVGFTNKSVACLEMKVAMETQERGARVAKAEQLLVETRCVPGIAEKARKLYEGVSTFETAVCAKV